MEDQERVIWNQVKELKVRALKATIKQIVRRQELRKAEEYLNRWYQSMFVISIEDRYRIGVVDAVLHDCQELLYLNAQEHTVLKTRQENLVRQETTVVSRDLWEHTKRLDYFEKTLTTKRDQLHDMHQDQINMERNIRRLQQECQQLIQKGIDYLDR